MKFRVLVSVTQIAIMERKQSASLFWFKCKFCQRVFRTRLELRLHKKREHLEQCIEEKRQISGAVPAVDQKFTSHNLEGKGNKGPIASEAIVGSDEYEWNVGDANATGAKPGLMEHAEWLSSSLEPEVSGERRGCAIKQEKSAFEESAGSVEPGGYSLRSEIGSSSSSQLWSHHAAAELNYEDVKTEYCEVHSGTVPATVFTSDEMNAAEHVPFSSTLEDQDGGVLPTSENQDDYCAPLGNKSGEVGQRDRQAQLVSKYLQKSECIYPMNPWNVLEQFQNPLDAEQSLRGHQCPHCPVAFISIATFNRHMREVHSDQLSTNTTSPEQPLGQKKKRNNPPGSTHNMAPEPSSALHPNQYDAQSAQISTAGSLAGFEPTDLLVSSASNQSYRCAACYQTFRRFESLKSHMRLKHPPNEAAEIAHPDVLELDHGAAGANTLQTLNELRIAKEFNGGDKLQAPRKTPTELVAPTGIPGNDAALGSNESSGSSRSDHIWDKKLDQSFVRSRQGYKCCKCVRYFKSRVALIRHYCEDHPTLFSCGVPRITLVTSLADFPQPSSPMDIESEKRSRVLPQSPINKGSDKDHCQENNGELLSKCSYCSQLVFPTELNRHERMHTGENPYQCNSCPMAFSRIEALKTHQKSAHDIDSVLIPLSKDFSCTLCDYTTSVKKYLHRHVRRRHNVNSYTKTDNQTVANSGSPSVAALKTGQETQELTANSISSTACHARPICPSGRVKEACCKPAESGGRPKCPYCCKLFCDIPALRIHIRLHTGEKPYGCSSCSEKFTRKDALQRHQQRIHQIGGNSAAKPMPTVYPTSSKSKLCSAVKKKCNRSRGFKLNSPTPKLVTLQSSASPKSAPATQNIVPATGKSAPTTLFVPSSAIPAPATQKFVLRSSQSKLEPVPCAPVVQTLTPVQSEASKSTFRCQHCSITCPNLSTLQDHESVHTGQKLHSCSKCSKVFSSRGNAIRHEKNFHRKGKRRPTSRPIKTLPPIDDAVRTQPVPSWKEEEPSESPDVVNIDSDSWETETVHLEQAESSYTCMLCDEGQEFVGPLESTKSHVVEEHKVSSEKAVKFVHLQ